MVRGTEVRNKLPKTHIRRDVRRVTSSDAPGRLWLVTRELPDQSKLPKFISLQKMPFFLKRVFALIYYFLRLLKFIFLRFLKILYFS